MSSHHAVLLSVDSPLLYTDPEWETIPQNNRYRLPQLGIDDVRTLISDAYRRPDADASVRVLIVATEFITEEAQQALLKIVEEPPQSTRFIFVIPHGYGFLPTLESRFERITTTRNTELQASFTTFKKASYSARILQIEDAVKRKDHAWQQEIKNGLITYVRGDSTRLPAATLKELEYVVRLLLTRGASNKFLLEHLALTLPA